MEIGMGKDYEVSGLPASGRQGEDQKSGFYAALIFFVWPLLALITAFRNYDSSWGKNILWAFVAFYGMSFAIGAESQNSDIVRYVAEVDYLHGIQMSIGDAVDYYLQSGEIDVLRTFIAIVVSRFTENQAVLTFIYGTIFGFFFSRNIWYLLERLKGKIRPVTILLIICFFLVIPFWNITTFRMWTAAHIFIYGLLPFLFERKWSGAFIASLSILVHFAFLIPVGILFAYIIFGNRLMIYFGLFIATFFVTEIDLEVFNTFIESYAPEIVQERTSGYRSEDYVESFREGTGPTRVWYAVWYGRALKWAVLAFLVILFVKGRKFFAENKNWLRLFSFTLLFYSVANIFSTLPSGGRYIAVANLIALALITLYIQNREEETGMRQLIIAATPALLLFVIVSVRLGLYSISATSILGNPIISLFFSDEHISMNDVMKMII